MGTTVTQTVVWVRVGTATGTAHAAPAHHHHTHGSSAAVHRECDRGGRVRARRDRVRGRVAEKVWGGPVVFRCFGEDRSGAVELV